jgi:hypothetical protein
MRNDKAFTMVSPSAGFTSRVMTRIAEHERAKAKRRALIGSALLIVFALIVIALIVVWLASWVAVFVTTPQLIVSLLNAFATVAFWVGVALNGLSVAASVVAENVGVPQMLSLAVIVGALTMLWLRIVAGSSFSSQTILGGSR